MGAPVIEKVRDGVEFTPAAAASFRRAEAEWGKPIDVNSTYRDYNKQMQMYLNWQAYVNGKGPHPGHSRAIHPDLSKHSQGLALDSDDWTSSKFRDMMARHGWIRTADWDPTEQHHFEYQSWNDQHINEPVPEEDDMTPEDRKMLKEIHHRVHKGITGKRVAHAVWSAKSGVNGRRWGDMLRTLWTDWRMGRKGHWHHGEGTAAVMSEIGAQKIFRAKNGGDPIDVEELAETLAPLLSDAEAEEFAAAVVKRMGKALTTKE